MDLDPGTSKFDLTLAIPEMTDELHCFWEYSLDLFNAATIERMTRNFQTLLCRCVAEPDLTLSQIKEGLTEGEKQQQLIREKGLRENRLQKFKATRRRTVAIN
jgi:non-ribosomal peptide synthetase component F